LAELAVLQASIPEGGTISPETQARIEQRQEDLKVSEQADG
jgi:hypothetical protein